MMQTVSRLIETFVPENYQLSLSIDRVGRSFNGTVTINGESRRDSTDIRLHSKDLVINSVTFDGKAATFSEEAFDELVITHPDIAIGKHVIAVSFSGAITDTLHGMYPSYFEHNGQKKELLSTQLESHHAREVFPCIDEPAGKATFDVTLITEPDVTVLGNMPIKKQGSENNMLVTTFDTTPRMSTYLLAWVIGELHKKTAHTKSGVEVNVWATPAQPAESMDMALDLASRTIDYFEEYFDMPYPLPKSDHVALPDFSSAAMENWGLITYRETCLLADPQTTSLATKQFAATVITHELSHQWFGNLVTMEWWNDLWLNESFANLMAYYAVDALEPDWKIWLDYANREVIAALRRDAIDGVQPIQVEVNHPDEIASLFDPSIVYAKGGRTLYMLRTFLGEEAFQNGLRLYFKQFAYKNTIANDLWAAMTEASGQDVTAFMQPWLTQPGYPVVSVDQQGETLTLAQEQFFIGQHQPSDRVWPIPLHASDPQVPALLADASMSVTYYGGAPLRMNTGSTTHYITRYSPELFAQLLETLPSLPDIDRLHLLHEQTLLAQAGAISSAELIPLLKHYQEETNEAVWGIVSLAINELKRFVETDEAAEKKLRAYVGTLAREQHGRLGWDAVEGEPESDTKLRSTILALMSYSEDKATIQKALDLYGSTPVDQLDPELRIGIMGAAVRHSGRPEVVDALLIAHQQTHSNELQEDIAAALCSTKDLAIVERLIGILKDASIVRPQDFLRWYIWLMRNRYGRTPMWDWTRQNWEWLAKTFEGDTHFDDFPRYVAGSLVTAQQLDEYKAFFEPLKDFVGMRRNIDMGIGELSHRVSLIERDGQAVRQALLQL